MLSPVVSPPSLLAMLVTGVLANFPGGDPEPFASFEGKLREGSRGGTIVWPGFEQNESFCKKRFFVAGAPQNDNRGFGSGLMSQ